MRLTLETDQMKQKLSQWSSRPQHTAPETHHLWFMCRKQNRTKEAWAQYRPVWGLSPAGHPGWTKGTTKKTALAALGQGASCCWLGLTALGDAMGKLFNIAVVRNSSAHVSRTRR